MPFRGQLYLICGVTIAGQREENHGRTTRWLINSLFRIGEQCYHGRRPVSSLVTTAASLIAPSTSVLTPSVLKQHTRASPPAWGIHNIMRRDSQRGEADPQTHLLFCYTRKNPLNSMPHRETQFLDRKSCLSHAGPSVSVLFFASPPLSSPIPSSPLPCPEDNIS